MTAPITAVADDGSISTSDAEWFAGLVSRRIGLQLADKDYLIASRLSALPERFGLDSTSAVITAIRRGRREVEDAAIEAMTTNETSFYRDHHPFDALADHVIPELIAERGPRIAIWNGACSSGQESYTLAMMLHDRFPELTMPGRARIISTDVSKEMVERTRAGKYTRFEVNRGLPTQQATKYFEQSGRHWVARKELRTMVDAREMNLIEPWAGLPRCDIVLLRNVLIYFDDATKRDILRRIRTEVLTRNGCLLLGASESTTGLDPDYTARRVGGSIFHQIKGTP